MIENRTNSDDKARVIDLLKRLGEEIHKNSVLIDNANTITAQLLVEQDIYEIENFEKQHVSLMEQLLRVFEKTQVTKSFWPKLSDAQGTELMLDVCVKLGASFQRQYEDMRLHLYAAESKIGRYPKPPSSKDLKSAGEALVKAKEDLTRSMLKLTGYYKISTLEW
jgi:hypothetical protein